MTPAIKIPPGSKAPVPAAPQAEFLPQDDYNKKLVGNVGPTDYVNPEPLEKYDLVSQKTGCYHHDVLEWIPRLTPLEPQSRFGDKLLEF